MQRRDFLKYSVALGVASALPLWSRAVFAAERPTLPIPDLLTTDARNRIQLTIGAGQSTFGEKTATTWGYNGNLLGPAVKLQRGKAVTVDIYNQLTEETTCTGTGWKYRVKSTAARRELFCQVASAR